MSTPCIITVAITGSVPTKKDSPAVPITVPEQVESTHAAYEAGASLVHVHVRNDDGTTTSDPEKFGRFLAGVRKHCPDMIVQFSTGGRSGLGKERGGMLHLKPEMASLTTGSVNFAKIIYENHPTLINDLAASMLDARHQAGSRDLRSRDAVQRRQARGRWPAQGARPRAVRARHPRRAAGRSRGARVRARPTRAHVARARHGRQPASAGINSPSTSGRSSSAVTAARGSRTTCGSTKSGSQRATPSSCSASRTLVGRFGRSVATPAEARQILGLRAA